MIEKFDPEVLWDKIRECIIEQGLNPDELLKKAAATIEFYSKIEEAHAKHATGIKEAHEEEANDWMFADEV